MSDTTNPPLDSSPVDTATQANEHTGGSIVNPPLEDPRSAASVAEDLRNPSLDSLSMSPAPDGLNPPLDDTDIERWFEQQLERARGAGLPDEPAVEKAPAKRTVATKRIAKKRATKRAAKKRSSPTKSVKKET